LLFDAGMEFPGNTRVVCVDPVTTGFDPIPLDFLAGFLHMKKSIPVWPFAGFPDNREDTR
jgi:hypothetical protein